ncbi:MAG: LacI family DNA-binding transcriptional regulator, partial [Kiritimatiellae bacterium]|nr:LacI family DNA-binding transcriptional regulator [Kiritimatiellia bacterium]
MAKKQQYSAHEPRQPAGRPTLKDVCARAGVSKATVSRVLNNRTGVGPEVRKRVLNAMKQLGYAPQAAARNLSRARSDMIGVVFQDLTSGWMLNIFRGVMHVASSTHYNVMTALSTTLGDELDLPRRLLTEGRVDGLLWLDPRVPNKSVIEMKKLDLPLVVLQRNIADPDINSVAIENTQGAHQAMSHLLGLGYRDILLITGGEGSEDSEERYRGALQALREKDLALKPDRVIVGHNVGPLAVRALQDYLDGGQSLPEAIFAFNDDMAIAIMRWLRKKGHRVPEDVALVGFDGIVEAEYMGLTTVETP